MANSKTYFPLFFFYVFVISSHVLTHELPDGHKHSYSDKQNNSKLPTLSQDSEKEWRLGSIDVEERIPLHKAEVHELEGSTSGSVDYHPAGAKRDHYVHSIGSHPSDYQWPPFPPPRPIRAKRHYYTHSVGYQPSGSEDVEPENYEDGSVMRHRKMMRPSEIDWKSFHAFLAKTSSMTNGVKTGYNGFPIMEEVGEETMN